ncbi:NAD(P)-dependent alcohol dehydrogenase [Glycomyces sp. L485]|uniref:NAD(P)-dependent alcohol dehydrogenase n=1 Tax=Glycomyces sp. L485 TaxID=2909235 RepID=UPI001F4BA2C2|nr:NAD(P)-dependent alcohol dehydrogenase [Glycomyces sp. L485]MCH7230284.1 NAD(P)-dependent alcohol dehydrogenase [Glycomyces sp. L485]
MRAITQDRYGPPEVLHPADIPEPVPGDDEVLVRVHAAGLGAEVWHLTTGLPYPVRLMTGTRSPKQPVPGIDFAGVVEAVGPAVTGIEPGEEVYGIGSGTFAEHTVAKAAKIARKPANLTFEQAAVVPVSGMTALQTIRDTAKIKPGQRVLVIGAGGGVGTFAVQIAKAAGAEVTGVCSKTKTDTVTEIGADHVIDYTRTEPTDRPERYDAIIDTAGHRPLHRLRRILAERGTLVIVGSETPGNWLGGLDRQMRAALVSPFTRQSLTTQIGSERAAHLEHLARMLTDGTLTPVIGRTHPLTEVPEALRHFHEGHALGKTAITI